MKTFNKYLVALVLMLAFVGQGQAQQQTTQGSLYSLDVLNGYMYKAYINWLHGDDEYAALEMKKATEFVQLVLNYDRTAESLSRTHATLKGLHSDLLNKKPISLQELRFAFGRVHTHLSMFHYARAEVLLKSKDTKNAGYALRHAYHHLAHGLIWTGVELDANSFADGWALSRENLSKLINSLESGESVDAARIKELVDSLPKAFTPLQVKLKMSI